MEVIGYLMIAGGFVLGLIDAMARDRAAGKVAEFKATEVPDIFKSALTAPIANTLVVLGVILLLIEAGKVSIG